MPKNKQKGVATKKGKGSGTFNKKDEGGQKQKGKTTGSSRKGYNQANARGNLCFGRHSWAASSNIMCILARIFDWGEFSKKEADKIKTTDDFIKMVKDSISTSGDDFWDGWAIAHVVAGVTGKAKVLAGANQMPTIFIKSTNLRMPNKRAEHFYYAEAMQANSYKVALVLDSFELEALEQLGLVHRKARRGAAAGEDVQFVADEDGQGISPVDFMIRDAARCINSYCRFSPKIEAAAQKVKEQEIIPEEDSEEEDIINLGGHNKKGHDFSQPDLSGEDSEEWSDDEDRPSDAPDLPNHPKAEFGLNVPSQEEIDQEVLEDESESDELESEEDESESEEDESD